MRTTKEIYRGQSFRHLRDIGCFSVYHAHINMVKESLAYYTKISDYNQAYKCQKDIAFFEKLIRQAKDN